MMLGSAADPQSKKLIMGATFGIALTMVVFAGSELFTGHNMYMPLGWMKKTIDLLRKSTFCRLPVSPPHFVAFS